MREQASDDRTLEDYSVYLLVALCILILAAAIYGGITIASEMQGIAAAP